MIKSIEQFFGYVFLTFVVLTATGQNGRWVGELDYGDRVLPFNFEMEGSRFTLINGQERIDQEIQWSMDSFRVDLKPFDAFIEGVRTESTLRGVWEKPYRGTKIPFAAKQGQQRFFVMPSRKLNKLSRWKMSFNPGENGEYPAVAEFNQQGLLLTGTVRTETGDFRYFDGVIKEDSIIMSSFDGAHGFILAGTKTGKSWRGKFYFDDTYAEPWEASENVEYDISDPFLMTEIAPGKHQPFYDLLGAGSGRDAIDASEYEGKVLIIQVFGTWCPNSLDQTHVLLDWYEDRPDGTELIAVTYEPNYSKEYGMKRIDEYVSHLQIPYDVFLGGRLSKAQAAMPFPFLDRIQAFPTLVILDKAGYARYVHSYFNGPATGSYYEDFKVEFQSKVRELLAE